MQLQCSRNISSGLKKQCLSVLGFHSPYIVRSGKVQCRPDSRLKDLFIKQLGEQYGSFADQRMQDFCGPEAMWSINIETMRLLGTIENKDL